VFEPGSAPSFVAGDFYRFTAEATHGPDQLRQPLDGRLTTTAPSVIEIAPASLDPIRSFGLFDHTIPSGATVTVTGSDDNFATTTLNVVIPWARDHLHWTLAADEVRAKYRVTITSAFSANWMFLGVPYEAELPNGIVELGVVRKLYRVPTVSRRRGMGVRVEHEGLPYESILELRAMLEHAGMYDNGRIGIVPNHLMSEAALVRIGFEELEVEEEQNHQPRDVADLLHRVSMNLEAVS
jgi:hypothetical protein